MYYDKCVFKSQIEEAIESKNDSRISVLQVDDEPSISKMMKELLELQGGFEVDIVNSVQCAHEKMKERTYDAIVSDYQMPGKDGLQFLKELRETGNNIPFILFTGKGREEVVAKALNLGANNYVNRNGNVEAVYAELAQDIHISVERAKAVEAVVKSEERYRSLLQNIDEIVFAVDRDGKLTSISPSVERISGFAPDDLVGKSILDLFTTEERTVASSNFTRMLEGEIFKELEAIIPRKNGTRAYYELNAYPVFSSGKIVGVQGIARDITDRKERRARAKKTEETLQESEERFRAIFEGANDGILVANTETRRFAFANSRICEITGYSLEELLKLSVGDIHPKKDLPHVINSFTKLVQGKLTLAKGLPVMRKDEKVVYCDISARSVKIGSHECLAGFFRDVTESRKTEEKIRLLSNVVQQASEGIAVSDLHGKILFTNLAWLEIHGFGEDEENKLLGKMVGTFYCGQQAESIDRTVQSVGIFRGRITQVRKDGTTFQALTTVSPLRNEKGQIIGIIRMAKNLREIVRDIRDVSSPNTQCLEKKGTEGTKT